jgi:hypothetical protein
VDSGQELSDDSDDMYTHQTLGRLGCRSEFGYRSEREPVNSAVSARERANLPLVRTSLTYSAWE